MTRRLLFGVSLIIICALVGGMSGIAAGNSSPVSVSEPPPPQFNSYTGVKSAPIGTSQQVDGGNTENITAWVPPPVPDGLSITPLEYLSLWAESYTQNEAEIVLTEAGFAEEEISTAAKQYRTGIQRGRLYTRVTPEAKAHWNINSTAHARETSNSVSKIKWNTGRSSPTKDGGLYLRDVSYDLSTIEPSTIVMTADGSSPTERDSKQIYVAGDTLKTAGTFDYRIDRPEGTTGYSERYESPTRTLYSLQDISVSGPSLTLTATGNGPSRTVFGGGDTNSSSTATSASVDLQDISRQATLKSDVEVSVRYERVKQRLHTTDDGYVWLQMDRTVRTDSVTVSQTQEVYVADKQTVEFQYRPIEGNQTSGRVDVAFPDQWAAVNFPDGSTLVSARSAYTQRDFSYGFARTFTEDDTKYVRPTHTPVRSYYVGTADTPRLMPGTKNVEGVGRWDVGVSQYTGKTMYTEQSPSRTAKEGTSTYMSPDGAALTMTPRKSNLSISQFLNQTTAVGPAPDQSLAIEVSERPPVVQANLTADYVPINSTGPDANRVLEVTVTESASGEPINTASTSNLNVTLVTEKAGAEPITVNTNNAGTARVELSGTPRVRAIIKEGVDTDSGKLVQADADRASYTDVNSFIQTTPWHILETYIFPLLPALLVITLLQKVFTGSSTVGRIIFR